MSFFRSEPDEAIDSADGKRLLPKREKKRKGKKKRKLDGHGRLKRKMDSFISSGQWVLLFDMNIQRIQSSYASYLFFSLIESVQERIPLSKSEVGSRDQRHVAKSPLIVDMVDVLMPWWYQKLVSCSFVDQSNKRTNEMDWQGFAWASDWVHWSWWLSQRPVKQVDHVVIPYSLLVTTVFVVSPNV